MDRTDPDLDPLNYKIYLYEKNEWDNVPSVIPAFSFHFQRYVRGLSQFCYGKSLEETTAHLREEVFNEFPRVHHRIDEEFRAREENQRMVQEQIKDL